MKRIFVATQSGADWQRLLAKPKLHWKPGASAMTAAAAWEHASDQLPSDIAALLDATGEPVLQSLRLLSAFPEWQVELPGGTTTSNTDVLAICRNAAGLCILGVEAKVLEDFGPLLSEKRRESSSGQAERLNFLHGLLKVRHFDDGIRYQLLHRTASALLTAQDFHAAAAVMLVHAFDTPADKRTDFENFATALGAQEIAPMVFKVPDFASPSLYLAWCTGDASFRTSILPSAF